LLKSKIRIICSLQSGRYFNSSYRFVEKTRQAAEILDHNGAINIDAASSRQSQQNTTEATQTTTRNTAHTAETTERNVADTKVANTQSEKTIPIIEEQMYVG